MLRGFLVAIPGSLVPIISAFEIKLVGFGIISITLRQLFLLFIRERAQLLRDLLRDLFLDRENIGHLSRVLPSPKQSVVANIDKLCAN